MSHNVREVKKIMPQNMLYQKMKMILDNELPHQESSGSEYVQSEDEQNALDMLQKKTRISFKLN